MENYPSPSTATHHHYHYHLSPPSTPVTISDPNNPYPTTFVQADTTSFKEVVQMLTGSSQIIKQATTGRPNTHLIPPMKTGPNKKPSKLYERRNTFKNFKMLVPRNYNSPDILSPSLLDFPALVLSPVTPLISDPFNGSPNLDVEAEEKAIVEKGFYLHPLPVTTPRRESELQLLPLFPVTSPKFSGDSNCSNS